MMAVGKNNVFHASDKYRISSFRAILLHHAAEA